MPLQLEFCGQATGLLQAIYYKYIYKMLDFLTWLIYAPAYIELAATIFAVVLVSLPLCAALQFEDFLLFLCAIGLLSVLYF